MSQITVYSTKGQRMTKITSNATTWGELKKDLEANSIQHDGMQAVVRETKATLDLDGAVLPKGLTVGDKVTDDFVLFLSPKKQTAGSSSESMSYADLRTFIKTKRSKSQEAKDFFGDYTHDTKEELKDSVQSWMDNHKTSKVAARKASNDSQDDVNVDSEPKIVQVFNLVKETLDLLSTIPGISDKAEFEKLQEEATDIEFQLNHG